MRSLLLFGVAGVLGLVVDAAVLYALAPWLGWYGARALSFWAAASATWAFNRRLTFSDAAAPASRGGVARQYLHYLAAMLVGGAVNYGVYALALARVPMPWFSPGLKPLVCVALGSLAGMGVNYASSRWLIFRRAPRHGHGG